MDQRIKKIIFIVSIIINVIFIVLLILLFAFTLNSKNTGSVSFFHPNGEILYTSVSLVSTHSNLEIIFNPLEINLNIGEYIYYQLSTIVERNQLNYLITPLYDHKIIKVNPTGYGIQITAISTGDTVMQVLTGDGIKDLIIVTVK